MAHRHQSKVEDFEAALAQLFAQFGDSVARLQKLLDIHLSYPVNAMTRICKKLSLPMEHLISEIQIYPERQPNGQWLKSIKFRLPIVLNQSVGVKIT